MKLTRLVQSRQLRLAPPRLTAASMTVRLTLSLWLSPSSKFHLRFVSDYQRDKLPAGHDVTPYLVIAVTSAQLQLLASQPINRHHM